MVSAETKSVISRAKEIYERQLKANLGSFGSFSGGNSVYFWSGSFAGESPFSLSSFALASALTPYFVGLMRGRRAEGKRHPFCSSPSKSLKMASSGSSRKSRGNERLPQSSRNNHQWAI